MSEDYSWLKPMEEKTKQIKEETARLKEKIKEMRDQEDMPWVDLTPEEIEELRSKKFALTEYGKQRLKQLMGDKVSSEAEQQALDALNMLYEKHGNAMLKLAEIEKEEWDREQKSKRVLERYNRFYNAECSGLAHGTPITPEFQQAMTLECMLDALRYENLNQEFDAVSTADINALIEGLYQQGKDYLSRTPPFKDSADGVA